MANFSILLETPPSTKVYRVFDGRVYPYFIIGRGDGSLSNYFYLADGCSVGSAHGFYIPNELTQENRWFIKYDDAKEEMMNQAVNKLRMINEIYFNNEKDLINEIKN